jgi:transcriptional regulator of NAD metabolism
VSAQTSIARRAGILTRLRSGREPVRGSDLAEEFGVTRQVIVGDVAILRAEGTPIVGSPQGYLLIERAAPGVRAVIAVRHDRQGAQRELSALIDLGVTVEDVIVEHPVYGELRGNLMIRTPADVERFLASLRSGEAELLSVLTGGVHLHTVRAPTEAVLSQARDVLRSAKILLERSSR